MFQYPMPNSAKPEWSPPIQGAQVDTEEEAKSLTEIPAEIPVQIALMSKIQLLEG